MGCGVGSHARQPVRAFSVPFLPHACTPALGIASRHIPPPFPRTTRLQVSCELLPSHPEGPPQFTLSNHPHPPSPCLPAIDARVLDGTGSPMPAPALAAKGVALQLCWQRLDLEGGGAGGCEAAAGGAAVGGAAAGGVRLAATGAGEVGVCSEGGQGVWVDRLKPALGGPRRWRAGEGPAGVMVLQEGAVPVPADPGTYRLALWCAGVGCGGCGVREWVRVGVRAPADPCTSCLALWCAGVWGVRWGGAWRRTVLRVGWGGGGAWGVGHAPPGVLQCGGACGV